MEDWWQLTQGGSVLKPKTDATVNQQSWEGPVQNYDILPRIWERLDMRKGFGFIGIKKKKHWVEFYHYTVDVYTHCQDTF